MQWCVKNHSSDKTIYLGGKGGHIPDDITGCSKITGGSVVQYRLLKCDHEEADDRMMTSCQPCYQS